MRRLRFIPACLALLLTSCNEQLIEQGPIPGETGRVQFALSADSRHEIVGTKSTAEEVVPVDSFWVEIFNSDKRRIYCEKYADAKDVVLNLNTGDYRFLAKHGDSLGVGFNHAFYMADATFTVEPKKDNSVSAIATMANVKAQVVFGENIINSNFYADCYALLKNKNPKVKSALKFKKTETRAGYIPAGNLVFEVYAKLDGQLMYYPLEMEYMPNDFVTFYVDAGIREGDLTVTIKLDNSMEVFEKPWTIPAEDALPANMPVVTAKKFDYEGNYRIIEGESKADSDLEISIDSQGGVESLVMDIESEYLASLGIPSSLDFMNLDSETENLLKEAGFVWYMVQDNHVGVIDFESVATSIAMNTVYDGSDSKTSSFKVTATDKNGKIGTETVNIIWEISSKSTVTAEDYDVWATKIIAPKATFTKGEAKYSKLEYSQDGETWISLGAPLSVNGNVAKYKDAIGLQPGTPTQFRVVYKDKFYPRGEGTLTTEEAAQLGNSGFEDWTTQVHSYTTKLLWSSDATRDWYRPWASENDSWWDVNSKKTLVAETTPQYQEYKCVPTVYYSTDKVEGEKSAQLVTTYVNSMASDAAEDFLGGKSQQAGAELFIGTADASGNQATQGHAFPSRPTSLSFQYKYEAYQDDLFKVTMYVEDAEGNIIASKDFVGGTASSGWMKMTLDFDYAVLNKKAAKIYVCFRSTKLVDSEIQYRKTSSINVIGSSKGIVGSILWIDDLKLNY